MRAMWLLGLLGCVEEDHELPWKTVTGDDTAPEITTITTDPTTRCEVSIVTTEPVNGAVDVDYRTEIWFQLSDPDPTATIESDMPGRMEHREESTVIAWIPDAPLEDGTSYVVTLRYCRGAADLEFSTSSAGPPVVDPADLVGRTWAFDLSRADFPEPPGLGSVLGSLFESTSLLGVTSLEGDTMAMRLASGTPRSQDTCRATTELGPTDFSADPYFVTSPTMVTFPMGGMDLALEQVRIDGSFFPDGSVIAALRVAAILDARVLATAMPDLGYAADELCELMLSFGATCTACDDGEELCLSLVGEGLTAEEVSFSLIEVTADECASCETGAPVCE